MGANPGGARTLDEAVAFARARGVEIHDGDEAILAVFGHEMFELNALRTLFEERGAPIPGSELARLINDGIPGNLHDKAWDYADELVGALRRERAG